MLFNSYIFIFLYLPVVLAGFYGAAKISHQAAALWLGVASLFFYGWWNWAYVFLLLISICGNFAAGYVIGHAKNSNASLIHRCSLLATAISGNLALLFYFKYANFFIATANQLTGHQWLGINVILPLGISFFTFTQIAFLVDVHRGIAREYNSIHYLLFVTYFPHLIAGPVLHHGQMMPQFSDANTYRFNSDAASLGLTVFAVGLFKKVVLADQFALYANPVFDAAAAGGNPQLFEAWSGALAYSLQLYFDFSGYSDMAIGLSKMFNIDLPVNFNSPYKATSIIEFWRRWHITLSTFLRDYLYIPLGGNRVGTFRRYTNLFLTMLLGGLWHGANWTFAAWGGLHGLFLIVNHCWRSLCRVVPLARFAGGKVIGGALTFTAVVVAWVPFRAENFDTAWRILLGMFVQNGISLPERLEPLLSAYWPGMIRFEGLAPLTALPQRDVAAWLFAGLCVVWLLPNMQEWTSSTSNARRLRLNQLARWHQTALHGVFIGALLGISILGLSRESQFLYFQF